MKKMININREGKKIEEVYGKEKADEIRDKIRYANFGSKKPGTGAAVKKRLAGKSFEERFGEEKAKEMKKIISENRKGKPFILSPEKEKMRQEKIKKTRMANGGYVVTEEMKKNLSIKHTIPIENIINEFLFVFNNVGGFTKNEWNKFMSCNSQTIRNKFGSLDTFAQYVGIKFKEIDTSVFGKKGMGLVGKVERIAFDTYKKINPENIIIPQFSVENLNGRYYHVDWYDLTKNIVYEFDEQHHTAQKIFDSIRQAHIEKVLGCSFIRIKKIDFEKDFEKNLFSFG